MNQCLLRSLTAAVVMSAVGTTLPASAQQISQLEASLNLSPDSAESLPLESIEPPIDPETTSASQTVQSDSASLEADLSDPAISANSDPSTDVARGLSDLVLVIPHTLDSNYAATLYVNDIPVLTFLGPEFPSNEDKARAGVDATLPLESDPAARATAIAARIDQFHQDNGDPDAIEVRWNDADDAFVVSLADEDLVVVDGDTILPDTTNNPGDDALQIANRLRRLLGGAEPLAEIPGRPRPGAPSSEAAPSGNWNVVSVQTGRASWYGPGLHGRRTASGEVFNQNALTAAHRTLPFGTTVRVTNVSNNRQVILRINDRGPFSRDRVIDLSAAAAREIGLDRAGVGAVRIEVLSTP